MTEEPAATDQAGATKRPGVEGPETDKPDMQYEAARDELIQVVQKLETGGTTLEESLQLWERGEKLAVICQAWLDGARARLASAAPGAEAEDDR